MLEKDTSMSTQYWPYTPACSNKKFYGHRRPFALAKKYAYIQANQDTLVRWIIFDVDRKSAAFAWEDAGLPPPTWITINPDNGHAHLCYGLNTPVRTEGKGVSQRPIRYLQNIRHAMCQLLKADAAYSGAITKNPYSSEWKTIWHGTLYDLGELEEYIPGCLSDHSRPTGSERADTEIVFGRNVSLFDATRQWAYRHVMAYQQANGSLDRFQADTLAYVESLNNALPEPLPYSEVRHIASSVSRWTARHIGQLRNRESLSNKQRERAQAGAKIRREALEVNVRKCAQLAANGLGAKEISVAMKVSLATTYRWLKIAHSIESVCEEKAEKAECQTIQINENQRQFRIFSHEPVSDNSGLAPAFLQRLAFTGRRGLNEFWPSALLIGRAAGTPLPLLKTSMRRSFSGVWDRRPCAP